MGQEINIRFTPSQGDYQKAIRAYLKRKPITWIAPAFFLGSIVLYLIYLPKNITPQTCSPVVMVIMLVPILLVYQWVWVPLRLGHKVWQHDRFRSETVWRISDDKIWVKNQYVESKFDWGMFCKVIETRDLYLLIYTVNKKTFQFIPRRAFESEEQESSFRHLVQRNVGKMS